MKTKTFQKLFSVFACFSLLANSLYAPVSVLAQELTPEPTPVATETPVQTPGATVQPSATPTETPVQTTEPATTPVVEATPASTPAEGSQPQASPTETTNPTNSPTPSPTPNTIPTLNVSPNKLLITDKIDYTPLEIVNIQGMNLLPLTVYTLVITSNDEPTINLTVPVVTNINGGFSYDYQLDGSYRPNYQIALKLEGVIIESHSFTDNRIINSVTLNSGSSVTVAPGATISVAVNVTTNNTGNNDWQSTGWRIATSAGSVSCANTGNHTNNGTFTENFNATAPSNPGIYNAYFIAYSDDGGSNGCDDNPSATYQMIGKVIVTSPDLVAQKTNNVAGVINLDDSFIWNIHIKNQGNQNAVFHDSGSHDDDEILIDELPENATYSNLQVASFGTTGAIDCEINNKIIDCDANGGTVTMPAGSSIDVSITVKPEQVGELSNPRSKGDCKVDPKTDIDETNENNNKCSNSVNVSQEVVENPTLPNSCGLDIAVVIDSSGSINESELTQMKNAFLGFVNALLPGTPTQFSVTEFDTTAAIRQGFTNNTTLINNAINGSNSGGYTNWEDGLIKAQSTFDPTGKPNLVIFASDGNPNRVNDGDSVSEDQAASEAVLVANSIKSSGTRIVALGIGNNLDLDNLKAISGPNVGTNVASDVITSNFDTLATDLTSYAKELCGGKITVTKMLDGEVQSGWEYSTNVTSGNAQPGSGITGQDGTVQFDIIPSENSATVDITETVKPGYHVISASCTKNNESTGSFDQIDGVNGITMGNNDIVSCVFNNTANTGIVDVTKYNDLNINGEWDPGEPKLQGWTINLSGQVSQVTNVNGETTFSNVATGLHQLSEEMQEGWDQSNISCYYSENNEGQVEESGYIVNVLNDTAVNCYIGNYQKISKVNITKTNDRTSGVGQNDTINYSLVVTNTGSLPLNDLEVIDALPGGFTYVAGSTQINGSPVSDPIILNGVLTWTIGYLGVNDFVKITYKVVTPNDLTPGTYKNLATCKAFTGGIIREVDIFEKISDFISEERGQVECDPATSMVVMNGNQSYGGNIEGKVLGASTILPGTGSETTILVSALAVLGFGLGFKLISRRKYAKN